MTSRRCVDHPVGRPRRWIPSIAAIALLGVALVAPRPALAQSSKASAEVLFSEGRRLMGEGKVDEACPKFADSQKLDPSSGTLLNLANCYEKLGRNASAWATYQEAASLAASTQRADHLPVAQKRAAALLPLLAKVTVSISHPVEGLEIKRDGVPVARSEWGLAVPVDPGSHAYVAEAPGYKPARVSLTVPPTPEGGPAPSLILALPDLEKLPLAAEKPVVAAPAGPVGPVAPPPSTWRPQRTWALVIGGVGLVGFGVAAGFAGLAKSTYNSSLPNCAPADPSRCSLTGFNQRNDALQQGNIATGALAVGAAAAVAGVVLWATAPEPKARTGFEISPGPGSVRVSGRW